jgi:hypothetical protein
MALVLTLLPVAISAHAGIGVPLYLATLNGLVAVTPNNTLYVPAPSGDAQAGLFVLDANGTVVKPCISVVFIKTASTNRYCRFSDALLASLISGVKMQGLVCDLPTVSNATAFIYQGNQLTFMQLRLAVSTQGQVVFGQENETVAPVVPVAPGESTCAHGRCSTRTCSTNVKFRICTVLGALGAFNCCLRLRSKHGP